VFSRCPNNSATTQLWLFCEQWVSNKRIFPVSHNTALVSAFRLWGFAIFQAHQYNETNVMHFSFNVLRIKGLYMFRALLAHLQEALHKRYLVYCLRRMSVGCAALQLTLYSRNIPNAVCAAYPEDEQVMFETCRGL
jgi:hypothetical protein